MFFAPKTGVDIRALRCVGKVGTMLLAAGIESRRLALLAESIIM